MAPLLLSSTLSLIFPSLAYYSLFFRKSLPDLSRFLRHEPLTIFTSRSFLASVIFAILFRVVQTHKKSISLNRLPSSFVLLIINAISQHRKLALASDSSKQLIVF